MCSIQKHLHYDRFHHLLPSSVQSPRSNSGEKPSARSPTTQSSRSHSASSPVARSRHQLKVSSAAPLVADLCPALVVCTTGENQCSLASLEMVSPIDLVAVHDRALSEEIARAALDMLRKVDDMVRIAREWERLDGSLVCTNEVNNMRNAHSPKTPAAHEACSSE